MQISSSISFQRCDQALSGVPGAGPNNSGCVIGIIRPGWPGGVGGGGPGGVLGTGRGGGERLLSGRLSHQTGWSGDGRVQADLHMKRMQSQVAETCNRQTRSQPKQWMWKVNRWLSSPKALPKVILKGKILAAWLLVTFHDPFRLSRCHWSR